MPSRARWRQLPSCSSSTSPGGHAAGPGGTNTAPGSRQTRVVATPGPSSRGARPGPVQHRIRGAGCGCPSAARNQRGRPSRTASARAACACRHLAAQRRGRHQEGEVVRMGVTCGFRRRWPSATMRRTRVGMAPGRARRCRRSSPCAPDGGEQVQHARGDRRVGPVVEGQRDRAAGQPGSRCSTGPSSLAARPQAGRHRAAVVGGHARGSKRPATRPGAAPAGATAAVPCRPRGEPHGARRDATYSGRAARLRAKLAQVIADRRVGGSLRKRQRRTAYSRSEHHGRQQRQRPAR